MQSLSQAVAALQAQRDQEAAAAQAARDQAEQAKLARETTITERIAAYLEQREGVDLTSPTAEARVVGVDEASEGNYGFRVNLPHGYINPLGGWLQPERIAEGNWDRDGWRAHWRQGQNVYTVNCSTFLRAALEVYQATGTGPFAQPADAGADV
jgi:hypothetical protein